VDFGFMSDEVGRMAIFVVNGIQVIMESPLSAHSQIWTITEIFATYTKRHKDWFFVVKSMILWMYWLLGWRTTTKGESLKIVFFLLFSPIL
jgi:hypothetical protein